LSQAGQSHENKQATNSASRDANPPHIRTYRREFSMEHILPNGVLGLKQILNEGLAPLATFEWELSCKAPAAWSPTLADMDFARNCTSVASFINMFPSRSYNVLTIIEYVRMALPTADILQPTGGQIMDWFICSYGQDTVLHDGNDELFDKLIVKPYEVCEVEICNVAQWSGNADIAGLGVLFQNDRGTVV
jgi:hypothetical protein